MSVKCPECDAIDTVHQVTPGVQYMTVLEIKDWGCEVSDDAEFFPDENRGPMYQCTTCDAEFNFDTLCEANQ